VYICDRLYRKGFLGKKYKLIRSFLKQRREIEKFLSAPDETLSSYDAIKKLFLKK